MSTGGRSRRPAGTARAARPLPPPTAPKFAARARLAQRRSRRRVLLLVVGLVVAVALVAFVWSGPLLVARTVQVKGVAGERVAAVRSAADVPPDQRLLRLDTDDVRRRVHVLPFVARVSVHRRWPSTVLIDVEARTPAAAVPAKGGGYELVDAGGVSYTTASALPPGLPVIHYTGGGEPTATLVAALRVLAALPESLRGDVSRVSASSPQDIELGVGRTTVRWGGPEDSARKVAVFEVLRHTNAKTYDVSSPETPVLR